MSSTSFRKPLSRLGRGLSSLIPDASAPEPVAAAPAATDGLRNLPIEALEPGPFQPRGGMDRSSLEDLAASIREHGILQPILVRPKTMNNCEVFMVSAWISQESMNIC